MNRWNRIGSQLYRLLYTVLVCLTANSYILWKDRPGLLGLFVPLFLCLQLTASLSRPRLPRMRLRVCHHGCECLRAFLWGTACSVLFHVVLAFFWIPENGGSWGWSVLVGVAVLAVLFWNGILCVYAASVQLGIRHRVVGLLCGWIPVVHWLVLGTIIQTVSKEVVVETDRIRLNRERRGEQICRTRYPILMVHGVFFRDYRFLGYWGRIPEQLRENGAQVFFGNHESAASVENAARELVDRIGRIVEETGCGKVNIIAHSKGGLDCRYAISCLGAAPYVASLTTINTPHRGCGFADYLLGHIPEGLQRKVASAYNAAMKKLGDARPDFMAAVRDLTASRCQELNEQMPDVPGVYYQSVGSKLNHATNGKFPLNFSYPLVRYFDGPNDGLVAEGSFPWGEAYTFLTVNGRRGISHGDMIDLNRENIPGFDVREFYVQLVSDLREKGL